MWPIYLLAEGGCEGQAVGPGDQSSDITVVQTRGDEGLEKGWKRELINISKVNLAVRKETLWSLVVCGSGNCMCGNIRGQKMPQFHDGAPIAEDVTLARLKGSRARLEGLMLAAFLCPSQQLTVTRITRGPSARRRLTTEYPPGLWPFARLAF